MTMRERLQHVEDCLDLIREDVKKYLEKAPDTWGAKEVYRLVLLVTKRIVEGERWQG